jgi:hypothetical protein
LGTDIAEGTVSGVNGFVIFGIAFIVGSRSPRSPFPTLDAIQYSWH